MMRQTLSPIICLREITFRTADILHAYLIYVLSMQESAQIVTDNQKCHDWRRERYLESSSQGMALTILRNNIVPALQILSLSDAIRVRL